MMERKEVGREIKTIGKERRYATGSAFLKPTIKPCGSFLYLKNKMSDSTEVKRQILAALWEHHGI